MRVLRRIRNGAKAISGDIGRIAIRELSFYMVKPTSATIFLTYRCNSQCKTCSMWKLPAMELEKTELGVDVWKSVIDKLCAQGISVVEVFGGNVLLRKGVLIPILRHMKQKGMAVHFPTNQIGLDDDVAKALAECADSVYISTDGIGERQDDIRGVKGASKKVEDGLSKLLRHRRGKNPRLICNTTVSKYNAGILRDITEFAIKSCFDEIHFEYAGEFSVEQIERSIVDGLKPAPYYVRQDESILLDRNEAERLKKTIVSIKKEFMKKIRFSTVNIDVLSVDDLSNGTIPHKKCYIERSEVTIDPCGNIIICPFINNYKIGNLAESDFNEIWNNYKHRKFRDFQNSGRLAMCSHCILGAQRNPGIFTSLKRVYYTRIEA